MVPNFQNLIRHLNRWVSVLMVIDLLRSETVTRGCVHLSKSRLVARRGEG
jgi:hypothetical protein